MKFNDWSSILDRPNSYVKIDSKLHQYLFTRLALFGRISVLSLSVVYITTGGLTMYYNRRRLQSAKIDCITLISDKIHQTFLAELVT